MSTLNPAVSNLQRGNASPKKSNAVWIIIIIILVVLLIAGIIAAYFIGRGSSSAVKSIVGGKCTVNADCETTLLCATGTCVLPTDLAGFGQDCGNNSDCQTLLSCIDDICQCPSLSPPQGINVSGVGLGSIKIYWTSVPGANGYIVYANVGSEPDGNSGDDQIFTLPIAATTYTFVGLPSLSTLYASVRAFNNCGEGNLSLSGNVFDP